jgi:cytochrome c oxidase subunit 3
MRPPYPDDSAPFFFGGPSERSAFERLGLQGLGLAALLVSLSMLFAAGVLIYLAKRSAGSASVDVPPLLWASTAILAVSAVTMGLAQTAARRGRLAATKRHLIATAGLGTLFLAVQTPALVELIASHRAHVGGLYGAAFFLIILHGVHVLGGLVPLAWMAIRSARSTGTWIPSPIGVQIAGAYWHFLEIVWLALLVTFLLA